MSLPLLGPTRLRVVDGRVVWRRPLRVVLGAVGAIVVALALAYAYLSFIDARPSTGSLIGKAVGEPAPLTPSRPLKVMSFNIRHAEGEDRVVSVERIAEIIRASGADVVGLQEVERRMPRSGWSDQIKQIAARLGYDYAFGRNLGIGPVGFGNAVLSRYPIVSRENIALPGLLEPRGALVVTIDPRPDDPLTFIDTHLGLSTKDRQEQVGAIVEAVKKLDGPIILVGDFNATRGAPEQAQLSPTFTDSYATAPVRDGEGTFGVADGKSGERIDFVWLSDGLKTLSWAALPSTASDHQPVVVQVVADGGGGP